jgi:16S rRNA (guanine966-N2)-methyltransferase
VLDVFAGTGAFGLEALSRGAGFCSFIENAPEAALAIRTNIAACRAAETTKLFTADALHPPRGQPHDLVFLDPPYGLDAVPLALAALDRTGWIAPGAIIVAEIGPTDSFAPADPLAERRHGQARLIFWRFSA